MPDPRPADTGNVNVRFSFHEDNTDGSIRYQETHQVTTNAQGFFSLSIGDGNVVSGNMAAVDCGHHKYYLQVELKPAGGSGYSDLITAQLLSVPYAMYASQSSSDMTGGNGIQIQKCDYQYG